MIRKKPRPEPFYWMISSKYTYYLDAEYIFIMENKLYILITGREVRWMTEHRPVNWKMLSVRQQIVVILANLSLY